MRFGLSQAIHQKLSSQKIIYEIMIAWLNLLRWPNLLLIFITHILFRLSFLDHFELGFRLNPLEFFLLSFSIISIAAAGNIINDIFDIKTDFVNKRSRRPIALNQINFSKAYSAYFILNIIAITLSFYISFRLELWSLLIVEFAVILVLYYYSRYFKAIPILGNVLVSLLVSLSFVLVLYFDMDHNLLFSYKIFKWILFYSVLAFWSNLNREWIKDTSDIKGDYAQNISTLPILIGKSRMNTLIFFSTLLLIVALFFIVKVLLKAELIFSLYFIFGICIPLSIVLYKIWKFENHVNYKVLSSIYKLTMLIGVFSLILFKI
ncbi:UbiA family prenyltransferase [Mesohalobacter halotolerans]|uniref:Prenyltransferase n=1 Tax=Mesohalobacter halotolerans TaxID=1883405 RepID=A0A4U5TQ75_9FLAO|nr:UbiA family prenyltransferase [Mesohalobacter halotolerans]TKS56183.1 hypothetical protein FCN74_09225 [Mesohalobacter halotolerans]